MVYRYQYAPQHGIYKEVLAVCLLLCVGGAGRSHYPKCLRRWPVWRSHGRSKGLRGGAVWLWWRSRWQKNQSDQDGVSQRFRGGSHGALRAVGGVTGRFQEITEAQDGVHYSVAEGGAVLRREVQIAVKPAAVPGELKEGSVHLRRMFLDGDSEVGGEKLVSNYQFGNGELQVGIIPGHGGRLVVRLPVRLQDHDRPGRGGRGFSGFSGSQRGHGRPSRKGDGRGYQGPGCGRGGGTERSRRGGNGGDRGGTQSQRLRGGGGVQSHKIGRSRGLPSSGGDISREMGRSQGLLCSGSGMSYGMRRSRLLGREPGEEGCMAALGHGDSGSGGAFLSRQRGDACLLLPEGCLEAPSGQWRSVGAKWWAWHGGERPAVHARR